MNIGDLVCYNAAGQKYKTLGLLLDVKLMPSDSFYKIGLIQWCVIGELMPRRENHPQFPSPWEQRETYPGDMFWHKLGTWSEAIK